MNILITGGTGLVGSVLIKNILDKGHNVRLLTRQKKNRQGVGEYEWDIPNKNIDPKVFEDLEKENNFFSSRLSSIII
jgi:nucleoside-diphosphate-sugar epimerase